MEEYLSFRKMITPVIIQILFWLGVLTVVISSFGSMFMIGGFVGFLTGLFGLVLGVVMVRVYCELIMVAFRMLDVLQEIRDKP